MGLDLNLSSSEDDDGDDDDDDHFLGGFLKRSSNDAATNGSVNVGAAGDDKDAFGNKLDENDNDNDNDNDNSDEDEDDYDAYRDFVDDFDDGNDRKSTSSTGTDGSSFAAMPFPSDFDAVDTNIGEDDEEDDEDEDDDINWEDAPNETDGDDDGKAAAAVLAAAAASATPRAVTLDLGTTTAQSEAQQNTTPKPNNSKRKRSVAVFTHQSLSGNPGLQTLLADLHKASLLAWVAHAKSASRCASCGDCPGLAHSLVPTAWWETTTSTSSRVSSKTSSSKVTTGNVPTPDDVGHFVRWFVDFAGPWSRSNASASASASARTRSGSRRSGTRSKGRGTSSKAAVAVNDKTETGPTNKDRRFATTTTTTTTTTNHRYHRRLPEYCRYLAERNDRRRLRTTGDQRQTRRTTRRTTTTAPRKGTREEEHPQPQAARGNDDDTARLLFLAMVRSLGWRARYVVAVEPISRDLDVDHPLFFHEHYHHQAHALSNANANGNGSVLGRFFHTVINAVGGKKGTPIAIESDDDSGGKRNGKSKDNGNDNDNNNGNDNKPSEANDSAKRSPTKASREPRYPPSLFHSNNNNNNNINSPGGGGAASRHVCWIEILCKPNTPRRGGNSSSNGNNNSNNNSNSNSNNNSNGGAAPKSAMRMRMMQWIHVDPVSGIVNQPTTVEETLYEIHRLRTGGARGGSSSSSSRGKANRRPIAYALAVEHWFGTKATEYNDNDNDNDLCVRMTDVTRRYASSMVETMRARGIAPNRPCSKPKRRKQPQPQPQHGGVWYTSSNTNNKKEERPDQWFLKLLEAINRKHQPPAKRKEPPPVVPSRDTQQQQQQHELKLKSKGKTERDAIALDVDVDVDVDESDSKPTSLSCGAQEEDEEEEEEEGMDVDIDEESQLRESARNEPLPTSKAAFKKHPLYVIRSVLNSTEVLKPDAKKRIRGMFKGELVYSRSDVETALTAKRWFYEGRRVKDSELKKPAIKTKARKKPRAAKGFKALKSYGVGEENDGSDIFRARQIQEASEPLGGDNDQRCLYGSWQTDPWGPTPVGPDDPIPVNDYNNVELELLNPGLVHVELYRVAKVAKRLNLPYAPCLLGFEGNRGNRTPTIRGIVVHEHNEELLREAHAGMADHLRKEEEEKREKAILLRWKRLLVGVLTKDRLEREYGDEDEDKK